MTVRFAVGALLVLAAVACDGAASAAPAIVPPAAKTPRGIVLISMDTVRADHTSTCGGSVDATPSLSRLARDGIVFENAFAQANETLFSHGSLFTGVIASHVGPVDYDFTIPDGSETLASAMAAAGYRTGAVVAGGHLGRVFGLDDGFESYAEGAPFGSFQETVPMAVRWIDQAIAKGEPFFLFVHGYDAHTPYVKPGVFARMTTPAFHTAFGPMLYNPVFYEKIRGNAFYPDFALQGHPNAHGVFFPDLGFFEAFRAYTESADVPHEPISPEERTFLLGTYASAVFYADLWVGVFLDELYKRGLLTTTTVAAVSDHGEALLEYGVMSHRHTLRGASTHVPLIIRPAGGARSTRVATPVSLIDVAPTLLEMAGGATPASMEGRSLTPCFGGECAQSKLPYSEDAIKEVSVTDGRHRLVVQGFLPTDPALDDAIRTGEHATFLLYDVAAGERLDIAGDPGMAPVIERLRLAMAAARQRHP